MKYDTDRSSSLSQWRRVLPYYVVNYQLPQIAPSVLAYLLIYRVHCFLFISINFIRDDTHVF